MAISVVQSKSAAGTSLTLTSPTTAGNCLVVFVCDNGGGISICTVTAVKLGGSADNFGASAAVTAGGSSAGNFVVSGWVDPSCAGGQTAIAATITNSNDPTIFAYELAGVAASSPVDKTSAGGTTTSSAFSSGTTATTAQASEIWMGAVSTHIGTPGAVTGYTNQSQSGAGTGKGEAGYQIVSATGGAIYNGTISASEPWGAAVLTLLGAASVSGTVMPRAALPAPRRRPARAVIRFTPVPAVNASGPAGKVQPRATVPVPRRKPARAWVRFTPVRTVNAAPPRVLLISLASQAGTDDYGNTFPQGILATEGVIEGPVLIGSDAFFYSPSPAFGNLTQSITEADGTDAFGNAWIAGTATYANNGTFWSAVVVAGGVVNWYKASGPGGPWSAQAGIGFTFNGITGGGLSLTAPAGISGSFAIPQPSPAATSAAIISALFAAGIFN